MNNDVIQIILNGWETNGYKVLDKYVCYNPNDIQTLFYSCILYEQEKINNSCQNYIHEHALFWKKELETYDAFNTLLREVKETEFSGGGWPNSIAIECSTYCNAKCRNCTHPDLIKSGKRKLELVETNEVYYRIRKCKLLSLLYHTDVNDISPVGLGEPLTHPDIIRILNYMIIFFPRVGLNTNASLLSDDVARKLARTELDYIYLSLSYYDKEIYEREIKLDYNKTVENMCNFLRIRKEENSKGRVLIHIFDNLLNSEEDIEKFKNKFSPLIRENDYLEIREYIELVENDVKTRAKKVDSLSPCYELWQVMMIDTMGNVFPCCMGVWQKYEEDLALGKISDSFTTIIENLKDLRRKQFEGNFGSCLKCGTLRQNRKFKLPLECYDKERSIYGDIQYKETTLKVEQLQQIEKRLK